MSVSEDAIWGNASKISVSGESEGKEKIIPAKEESDAVLEGKRHWNGTNPNAPSFLPSGGGKSRQSFASRVVGKK